MSGQNPEITDQSTGGRNPAILIGGLVVIVGAFLLLIFGGTLFVNGGGAETAVVAEQPQQPAAVLGHHRQLHPGEHPSVAHAERQGVVRRRVAEVRLRAARLGIAEARGAERFGMIANGLPQGLLKDFYVTITASEQRHYVTFLDLAQHYLNKNDVDKRTTELLDIEANICSNLPFRAALH